MVATLWSEEELLPSIVTNSTGNQVSPSVADSGGGSYGVAWTSSAGVTVSFYDIVGKADPALGTIQLTDAANAVDVSLTAGGAVGYAAVWEEAGVIRGRYVGLAGPVGAAFSIATEVGRVQHDAKTSGYAVDGANGKPAVDGFNVVWVSSIGNANLGEIKFQRFAVPLDARVDPIGPPVAAGLDGVVGGSEDPVTIAASGRDPQTIVTHDGDTVITWVDAANQVHLRAYGLGGNLLDGGIAGANLANLGTVSGSTVAKVVDLAGSGFVVAWVNGATISAQIFAPGAAAGTYTAGAVIPLQAVPVGFNGDFSLGTLIDTGGFSLSWVTTTALGDTEVMVKHFNSGGASDGAVTPVTIAGNQSSVALAGLVGDRIIAVYQDNSGSSADIGSVILDTRAPGVTLTGDDGGNGRVKPLADQLVGTVGNDTLDGVSNNDELYGARGDDTLTGGTGDDLLFGGQGADVAMYSGNIEDYAISYLGGDLFTIQDLRSGAVNEGLDTLQGVETFRFANGDVNAAAFIGGVVPVTPTAWGQTDTTTGAVAINQAGSPDVDGFVVNHAADSKLGKQVNAFVADSVGEFVGVVWETPNTGAGAQGSHIRAQFYDVILNPDSFIPNAINVSDGLKSDGTAGAFETNARIVSGGANSGWGIAFEERDSSADASSALKTNFVGPGALTGQELAVLNEGNLVNQHDAAMSGSFLDRTLASPTGGSVLPTGMNEGYNIAWVSTDLNADGTPVAGDGEYGRIMFQRFEVPLDALGNPGAPVAGGIDGIVGLDGHTVSAANDGAVQFSAAGRNPSTAALHTFETAVIWVESNGAGGEKITGVAIDDAGNIIPTALFDDISGIYTVTAGTSPQIVSAGAVNFGIVWITGTGTATSPYTVMATMISSAGTGLDGENFSFGAPAQPFEIMQLPAGFDPAQAEFSATGISGEDSNDLVVSWKQTVASNSDVMAQHIKVALNPITGIAVSMTAEGNVIQVNPDGAGNQDQGTLAGLLGDRFISVYHQEAGDDIVARVFDTRAPGQVITGDLVRAGLPQARRDVLVGTNGDDTIRGDISDADGGVDWIYGGLGNDTIQGGPGIRGAAGIPEIIDGGEGNDIAVFTGRFQDYSITVNGDGSIEVIDLRPQADAAGNPLMHDGIDNLYSIETLRFLNLTQADPNPAVPPAATDFVLDLPGTPPATPVGYNGTPVAWSLDDTTPNKEIAVDHSVGSQETGIAVTNLQDGAGLAWVKDGTHVYAITYDTTGKPDPILLGANTELTDSTIAEFTDNTVADIDVAMTAGLGMTAVWESTDQAANDGNGTSIHMRFASTNTHVVLDPAGGVPGPGLPGGEQVIVGTENGAIDPVIQGYEIVDVNNDTLEVGFHVGFVTNANAAGVGTLKLARYEIPVYDIQVDANGLPVLNGAGQGQLATDAFGNLVPSTTATFGTGSETAPMSIGLDGQRGTADDTQAIVLTDQGLFADGSVPANATALQGRDISIGSLHDGQLVVSYIDAAGAVKLHIYIPTVDEASDRETRGVGTDVVAQGITTYSELTLPANLTAGLGTVPPGQTAFIVPQQNGSFGLFWGEPGVSGMDIKGIVYTGFGTNWSPSPVITFEAGLAATVKFQVSSTGVNPGGLEDGFFVSWETAAGISGQRFDMTGATVGNQIFVGDPASGVPGVHSATGIDDGRMLIGYEDGGDVSAQFLDNREPGVALIGPRTGAPADVIVGTVGDDAIDGRALNDQLFGGLGNDLLTLGSGNDIGDGGEGNDTIIGGTGQDQLLGGNGDDLLWGGLSGPPDAQVDRDLLAGLTGAIGTRGLTQLLVNSASGADIISGGAGSDTISFQSELGNFTVDLAAGYVTSNRGAGGATIIEDVIGEIVDDGAGGTIFAFTDDVENATGGFGNDTLLGDAGDNILTPGLGSNTVDGRGGNNTLVLAGAFADYVVSFDPVTGVFTFVGPNETTIARNIQTFQFLDQSKTAAALVPGPVAKDDAFGGNEDTTISFNPLGNDLNAAGSHIAAINGTAIAAGNSVAVTNGSVKLTAAGLLEFTPAANYFGSASFSYTIQDGLGRFSTATVNVAVANVNDAPTDIGFNGSTATTTVSLAENSVVNTIVATLSTVDIDNTIQPGIDTFTYTLADNAGGRFKIVGNQILVNNGSLLDFESPNKTFTLAVTSNDNHGGSTQKNLVVNLTNVNEAPTSIASSGVSLLETAANNFVIGTLSATDPEGDALRFSLVDDAGGRFKLLSDVVGTNVVSKIAVAETLLIDHQANDANRTYTIKVQVTDKFGASFQQDIVLTATGVAESRVSGGANNDTLNGTGGNDYIDGGAGKDTMTGLGGNDSYVVDNGGDKVVEAANGGTDTIYTSLTSFDLNAAANVENLVYTGSGNFSGKASGANSTLIGNTGADQLSGGNGNDVLEGRAGNDTLQGGGGNDILNGGFGADILTGGAGQDTFVFHANYGNDAITDFNRTAGANHDLIQIDKAIFKDFADLTAAAALAQVGADTVITISANDHITVQKVVGLTAADFVFV